jgi:CRISPR/Cas system CSM-associated protein Csm2 small subunit
MKQKPTNIPPIILSEGIKQLTPIQDWGDYLAEDMKVIQNGRETKISKLSTSQIRKFFGAIKRIQVSFEKDKSEILFLSLNLRMP